MNNKSQYKALLNTITALEALIVAMDASYEAAVVLADAAEEKLVDCGRKNLFAKMENTVLIDLKPYEQMLIKLRNSHTDIFGVLQDSERELRQMYTLRDQLDKPL
tara:strand:- start:5200 stop:5514 length:315 start_codon:yes stop_codon:yes gene_type:complete